MLAIFFNEGDDVACLTNVCVIGEQGENFGAFDPHAAGAGSVIGATDTPAPVAAALATVSVSVSDTDPGLAVSITAAPAESDSRLKISPRARALAERNGVIMEQAVPTGPGGRVIERDVEAFIIEGRRGTSIPADSHKDGPEESDEFEIAALSGVRKAIAKSMYASLMNSAQLTLSTSFDASDVLEFRKRAKVAGDSLVLSAVSVTDIIVLAVSRTLAAHKSLNAHFLEDNKMKLFKDAHIGVAVDTPRGLLVPTISGASGMSLLEISAEARRLYSMCAQGSISPDLFRGASFTISNLGAFGIENFTPILNPPQTGILGVCAVIERWRGGKTYPAMGLSLTFDHRALDGADAARFLKDLTGWLENFRANAILGGP
jgi:pyruvate dehydrogenase E2 component (dihydrolipoamide acetyltransferase)